MNVVVDAASDLSTLKVKSYVVLVSVTTSKGPTPALAVPVLLVGFD